MESRLKQLEILELTRSEAHNAAAVLGRGMRDNPLHVRAFGANPDRREAALTRMFEALLHQYMSKGEILGAFSSGTLIGVCGMVEPERCQLTTTEKLRLLPAIVAGSGLGGMHSIAARSTFVESAPNDVAIDTANAAIRSVLS